MNWTERMINYNGSVIKGGPLYMLLVDKAIKAGMDELTALKEADMELQKYENQSEREETIQ